MNAALHLAFGNLREHKSKTFILCFLVTIGVAIIVSGNAFIEASRRGLEKDFEARLSGDVFIHGLSEKGQVSLFGVGQVVSVGNIETPAIPDTKKVLDIVSKIDGVQSATTAIYTFGILVNDNMGEDWIPPENIDQPYFTALAVDRDTYWEMLPAVTITDGDYPSNFESGILIEKETAVRYEKYYGLPLKVGDKIVAQGFSTSMILREVTVCGFYEPTNPDTSVTGVCYLDPNTARALTNLTYGSALAKDLPDEIDTGLFEFGEEDLFDSDSIIDTSASFSSSENFTEESLSNILGDTSLRDKLNETDDGAWHFILLRTTDNSKTKDVIKNINAQFKELEVAASADTWKVAASAYILLSDMISTVFSVLIGILAVVVFIVIMNTLIVSIIERTGEIGTMRAIGASRSFIRKIFFAETLITTTLASFAGVIIAIIVSITVNVLNIKVAGETAKVLLGGGSIVMTPTFNSILVTVLVIIIGSVAANLYPVSVALKITPLKAMNDN